ncbi:MAG: tetratricopeptide repeat protein [Cyanobacteria bacterium J06592_8]
MVSKFQQANQLVRIGKLEEAVAAYQTATEENAGFYGTYQNLGETLWKLGRLDEAIAAFRHVVELNPRSVWGLYQLGELLRQQKQFEEAIIYLRRAMEIKSDVGEFYLSLGAALVELGSLNEAVEYLRQAVELNPLPEAYYYLGVAQSQQQHWSEAVEYYRQGLEINPGDIDGCLGLAEALSQLGKWSEAVDSYRQVLTLSESGEVLFRLGQALGQLEQWEKAIVEYQQAINLGFVGGEVRHHLGYALSKLGRYEEAVVELRQVVEENPRSAPVRHQLGYALSQLQRWREAEIELRKSAELHPGSAVVWQQLGEVLQELGKKDEAVKVYQQVVEVQGHRHVNLMVPPELPLESSTLFQQALLATQKNDWSEAASCWCKLWKAYGDSLPPQTMVFISNELFKLDAFGEATNCLERVLAIHPDYPGALREQKNQYCYHAYSSWLMETVEGISDWYRADGLLTCPDWSTAVNLCQRFIKTDGRKNSPGAIKQYVRTNLLLAEEYWECRDAQNAKAVLQKAIESFGKGLPLSLVNSIIKSVDAIRENPTNSSEELSEHIQNQIRTINADVLSVSEWLSFYDVLNWNGFFKWGLVARQKGIQQAYHQGDTQSNKTENLKIAAMAAIDRADFKAADKYIDKLSATNFNRQELAELRAYKCLQEGDIQGFRKLWPHEAKSVDVRFQEYIQGKSVAIVGPAPTGVADGEEIDSFDVVIRFNYRGLDSMPDPHEYGTKTNISLYNAHTIRYLITQNKLGFLSKLDFCLIRRPRYDLNSLGLDKNKIRIIYESDSVLYKSLNGLPAVLFDVLLQGVGKVKLFKSNFYLTSQHHSQTYRGRNDADFAGFPLRKIQPVVANHDLISQISFTRNLWKAGLISVDEQCARILKFSDEDYSFEMEKLFPNFGGISVQKFAKLETKKTLPSMSMKQVIVSAETAMYGKNWGEAVNKLKLVLDAYSDKAPEKVYRYMSRALSAQGYYHDAEIIIQKGIAKYPHEIRLSLELAQIAYDKKDWSEMIFLWYQLLAKLKYIKNKQTIKEKQKQAYKNLAVAYGNLDKFVESSYFFELFLQTSEIAHQLKPYKKSSNQENSMPTKKESIKLLALIDDDSSLFTLADAISDFEFHGYEVAVAQIIHGYGKRVSERQISLTKIYGKEITNIRLSDLNKENPFIFDFDALLLCKHSNIFGEPFYKLNTTRRPCIIAFYPGVDFFPTLGISNRIFADIICFNNQHDFDIYNKILPATLIQRKRAFIYNPKFTVYSHDNTVINNNNNIKNVYFFAQSIVPLYYNQRLDVLKVLNNCAISNPNINLKIKLRHLPNENRTHSHSEQFPYVELAKSIEMASNVSFSTETMDEVFENADFCITCSSTAGIETAIRGIPTLFYLDFLEADTDPITKSALRIFQNSSLLCTKHDIINLSLKSANATWIKSFIPERKVVHKIIQSVKYLKGGFV